MSCLKCGLQHKANLTCNQARHEAGKLAKTADNASPVAIIASQPETADGQSVKQPVFNKPNPVKQRVFNKSNPVKQSVFNNESGSKSASEHVGRHASTGPDDEIQALIESAIASLGRDGVIEMLTAASQPRRDRKEYMRDYLREYQRKRRAVAKGVTPLANTGG
ncbi:hypothetical protein [Paraburkholderia sediminicola]|uniref:hypothetical protein n=1 Tax=Paraburkholderia sediminicola TaxID=458836 RepID=UPI0038BCFCC9